MVFHFDDLVGPIIQNQLILSAKLKDIPIMKLFFAFHFLKSIEQKYCVLVDVLEEDEAAALVDHGDHDLVAAEVIFVLVDV